MFVPFLIPALISYSTPTETADTLREISLDEVQVSTGLKEEGHLRLQPLSATMIGSHTLREQGISAIKDVEARVPNFFMPDYGSRQTSAIYARGIGSRIGTPAVGLYVDNVPYYDKTAFDFSFLDVARIDVLRGPQSTLYGRNAMGGLIRVQTRNPFDYQGTDVRLSWGSRSQERQVSLSHHQQVGTHAAFSASAFYEGNEGFYRNTTHDAKEGGGESAGARLRGLIRATDRLTFDATLSYEYTDEDAYPYFYTGAVRGDEQYPTEVGFITANLDPSYRRSMWNASVNAEYRADRWLLNSVTAWQGIDDRMMMDQDFLAADIYSLEQRQGLKTLSEELIVKSRGLDYWNWLGGLSCFSQWADIQAPVTFRHDGILWLNTLIADKMKASPMPVSVAIQGDALCFDNAFENPSTGAAFFGQATRKNLFGLEGLEATLGLRYDYEHRSLTYTALYAMEHSYVMPPRIDELHSVANQLDGKLTDDTQQLLPRFSLQYNGSKGNVYLTVSRGYRSGGYNAQGFSEPMQQLMQTDLLKNVRDITLGKVPPAVANMVSGVFDKLIVDSPLDIEGTCSYRPEYTWNYELGTHLDLFAHRLMFDASAYLCEVNDLQLSRMSTSGLGRTVVNAGSSRSWGTEIALHSQPIGALSLDATFGYTHASFTDYTTTDATGQEIDCHGNYVPYMPAQTLSLDAAYRWQFVHSLVKQFSVGANLQYVGQIYWDEANLHSQSGYALLGAQMKVATPHFDLQLWGRNLTQTAYDAFWFESMGRGYAQHGKPLQVGLTLNVHL